MDWKLAEAKNKLSEVVTLAIDEGPQRITRRSDTVFVISESDYKKLKGEEPNFIEFLLSSPGFDDVDLERNRSTTRDVEW